MSVMTMPCLNHTRYEYDLASLYLFPSCVKIDQSEFESRISREGPWDITFKSALSKI